jgi:signal transduction histidine kinase
MPAFIRRPLTQAFLKECAYLALGLLTGSFAFGVVVTTVSTSASLLVLVIGLPVAVLLAHVDRWVCEIDRHRAALVLGAPIRAAYMPLQGTTRLARWTSVLRDRQTWRDIAWMVFGFPVTIVGFVTLVVAWTVPLALLSAPIYLWSIPGWVHRNVVVLSILGPPAAIPAAIVCAWAIAGQAHMQAAMARSLLGPTKAALLAKRVETLADTRAGAVDAATTELQRVERDLHDGAQARLVALTMDLGMAEQRLANGADPEAAREHVAAAQQQARAAMAELRDLVRGIGPSILRDRGLDAALTALASGRTPPVALNVDYPATHVGARETAAYFVVAEALTNARKHAAAGRVSVNVHEDAAARLIVEVVDDGIGGADSAGGTGLQGLQKRVAALDGTLTVSSPKGGPTAVRAELP